ncbi:hypothetical protein [Microvirga splendida]|uniref:Uncharacterized protein n=1 Tax=Microvirga splendida TaxID=2795727 RepID=A0ABS0Y079_9HYPH|nr:hypothetical protein [Microvirga splendida]MBJ6125706.1 hypothetical protein [Microvirga splendida]
MSAMEALYIVFVLLAGVAMGSLVVLMIGHLMNEHWLAPVRAEVEAAALTLPLLLLLGLVLAFGLGELFPWVGSRADLPPARASYLSPGFFMVRSAAYLLICIGLAYWLTHTRHLRRASAIGLALLTPVMTFSAYDWVLSREPYWWSSLFGFAFALGQVLAALASAILITLLKTEPASPKRMASLERALLILLLLTAWTWFAQFLIVWLANLPHEVAWYLDRSDDGNLALLGASYALMLTAIVLLVPSGVSRKGMLVGSALALLHHGTHMIWVLQPRGDFSWFALGLILAVVALWTGVYVAVMRVRPTYVEEATEEP